jgi:hypothetical protein
METWENDKIDRHLGSKIRRLPHFREGKYASRISPRRAGRTKACEARIALSLARKHAGEADVQKIR